MNSTRTGITLVVFLILGLISLSAADSNFKVEPVDEPFSMNQTGTNTTTIQLVKLSYAHPGESSFIPMTPENTVEGTNIAYYYNKSDGNASKLEYLGGDNTEEGYWYAEFQPDQLRGDAIKYNASGRVKHNETKDVWADETANLTQDLNVGDLKIDILNPIPDEYKADRDLNVEVNISNATTKKAVNRSEGNVEVIFANSSGIAESYSVDNYDEEEKYFFHSKITTPKSTNSTYMMHIKASNSTGANPHATWTKKIRTLPAIKGELSEFNSPEGCEESSMVETCEAGAEININYTITAAEAEYVNLTVNKFNSSSSERVKVYNATLDRDGDHFTGTFKVPDINTSKYGEELEYVFNASNTARYHVNRRNISIENFRIEDRSSPTTPLGTDYRLDLFFHKAFSRTPLNKSYFKDINVEVLYPNETMMENFTEQDLTFDQAGEVMNVEFPLNTSMPDGSYDVKVNATNNYLKTRTLDSGFTAESVNATFETDKQVEFNVDTLWSKNYTVKIQNLVDQTNHLEIHENLSEDVELINNSVSLSPKQEEELWFKVNISDFNRSESKLALEDNVSGYNHTINITVNPIDCKVHDERLCADQEKVNVTLDNETKSTIKTVKVFNVGPLGEELSMNISTTGEAANYTEIIGDSENISLTDSREVEFNYSAGDTPGNFTGTLNFVTDQGEVEVDTAIDSNVTRPDTGEEDEEEETGSISVSPSSIDLGTFPEGEQITETVELTNELEEEISEVEVSSSTFAVSTEFSDSIAVDESADIELVFESVMSSSGTVKISAGSKSSRISVSADPIPNYKQRANNQLRPDMEDLQSEVKSDSDLESDLNEVSSTLNRVETQWDQGNYNEAESLYNEADRTLSRIQNEVNSGSEEGGGGETEDSGGIPILPVAGGIFLVILIAFVFFTSYVPEEGDPLYSVLGE